jgi:hypothetical protein
MIHWQSPNIGTLACGFVTRSFRPIQISHWWDEVTCLYCLQAHRKHCGEEVDKCGCFYRTAKNLERPIKIGGSQ